MVILNIRKIEKPGKNIEKTRSVVDSTIYGTWSCFDCCHSHCRPDSDIKLSKLSRFKIIKNMDLAL